MAELSLFDFEFEETRSEGDIRAAFEILKQEFKKHGNYYCMGKERLPFPIRSYFHIFEERGWVTMNDHSVYPKRDLLDYHTPEEAIEEYQIAVEKLLKQDKKCWYNDFLSARNHMGPCEFKTDEDSRRFSKMKKEVTKEAAITLGLDHFLNVPSSRGHKMGRFDSRWEKKHVIPMIAERIIPMTDYDDVEDFFKTHIFFCGRRDWTWGKSSSPIPPYPEYKTISLSEFDIACLAEASDEKTVALILSYTGGSGSSYNNQNLKILYPAGWSHKKYQESLTFDDLELIYLDLERLDRLHEGKYLNGRSA